MILITTGDVSLSRRTIHSSRSEVIPALSNNKTTCNDLGQYPIDIGGAVGGLLYQTTPFICGGESEAPKTHRICYILDPVTGQFVKNVSMIQVRQDAAGIAVNGGTELFVSGDSALASFTTEFVNPKTGSRPGPDMPVGLAWHCIVKVNDTTVMILGGWEVQRQIRTRDTYFLDIQSQAWTRGPSLITGRSGHACAEIADNDDNSILVAVSGGLTDNSRTDSLEIYAIGDAEANWKESQRLGVALIGSRFVVMPEGKYAVLTGGMFDNANNREEADNKMYQLTCTSRQCQWTTLNQTMSVARSYHVAMVVPSSFTSCQ